jgi:PAS domain S-box-containing protein
MIPRNLILFILIHLFCLVTLFPQQEAIKFQHVSNEADYFFDLINCVIQDSTGFLWIGSDNGLHRYNGYEFTVYLHDPAKEQSLSSNNITSICQDQWGTLWIGTNDAGLNKYNANTDNFSRYTKEENNPNSLSNNHINALIQDNSGILWIGTDDGLNSLNIKNGTFKIYKHTPGNPNSICDNQIMALCEDNDQILWIGTNNGLNKFNKKTKKFTHYKNDPNLPTSLSDNRIRVLYEDREGLMWVGTLRGLNRYNKEENTFSLFYSDPTNTNSLSINAVTSILEDSLGMLWIGTISGLNRLNKSTKQVTVFKHIPSDLNSLNDNFIRSLCEDRTGIIWIGTYDGGLNKLHRQKERFITIKNRPGDPNSLSNNIVMSIYEDESGIVWIGTLNGLNRYDKSSNRFTVHRQESGNKNSLSSNSINIIHKDKNGILWLGTRGRGLNRFDWRNKSVKVYQHDAKNPNSLSNNTVKTLYEDPSGTLWIGTALGLNKFNKKTEQFTVYKQILDYSDEYTDQLIRAILEDKNGILWIGTGNGLIRFNKLNESFKIYKHIPGNDNSLSHDRVYTIFEDASKSLWIGTHKGLNKLDKENETFTHYTVNNGLPHNVIFAIQEDDNNNLWLSTNNGLSRAQRTADNRLIFKNYTLNDGIQGNEFNSGASFKNERGDMYFGGMNGFNIFHPDKMEQENKHIPPVVITDFQILFKETSMAKRRAIASILNKSALEANQIKLSYKENYISLKFSALDYMDPKKNQYAYKMEGFNNRWVNIGNRRSLDFNLPPKEYIFKVKGSNNDGVWNEKEVFFKIIVSPPFWATWWFRVLMVSAFLFIILIWHKVRVYQIKRINKQLEETNLILSKEIIERKQVEENLQKSEERLSLALEAADLGLWDWDVPTGKVQRNKLWSKILGYKSEEIKATFEAWEKLIHPDDLEKVREAIQNHFEFIVPYYEVEHRLLSKSGEWKWMMDRGKIVKRDKSGKPIRVAGTLKDIHSQKTASENLTKSRNRIKSMSMQMEQLSLSIADMIATSDTQEIFTRISKAIVDHSDFRRVLISYFKEIPPYRDIIGYGGVDKKTIERLRKIEMPKKRYLAIFENGIKVGQFSYYIPYTMKDLLPKDATDFGTGPIPTSIDAWHPEDNLIVRMNDKSGDLIGVISVDESKSGQKPTVETVRPLEIFSSIISEIVIYRKAEQKLKTLEEQLFQAQKMESIGRLAGGVAHDFNNILTGIMGYAELLKMQFKDPTTSAGHAADIIFKGAERAANLTMQLLGFAREGKQNPVVFKINDLVKETLKVLEKIFQKRVTVKFDFEKRIKPIEADKNQIEQVLTNIIINANDAMPQGGILAFKTENVYLDKEYTEKFPEFPPGDYNKLTISDTGIGIPKEIMDHIFEPFFTTKGKGEGTGLGLATAYGIINNHGGQLNVSSEQGIGTTFTIILPATKKSISNKILEGKVITGEETILLVDDEEDVRTLSKSQLETLKYKVLLAANGPQAIKIYKKNKRKIDLVIVDMIMPEMNGKETFSELQKIDPKVKVLLMSGFSQKDEVNEVLKRGAIGFIQKPFTFQKLSTDINKALKKKS